jgi:hypothetical protein
MASNENDRLALRAALAAQLGEDVAEQIMESLPPFSWHDVARQDDLVALRNDVDELRVDVRIIRETLDLRFDSLRDGLSAQFHADLVTHTRTMVFSLLAAVFTAASLAFAAVRF